jgi:hypothetical protein
MAALLCISSVYPSMPHPQKVMTIICKHCSEENPVGITHCLHCGGPVKLLEPLVVQCGWCSSSNFRDKVAFCISCGGDLPALPGGNPGPRPPMTPRVLPEGYETRVKYWKNTLTLIGMAFTIVFFWAIIFPIIGVFLWRAGHQKSKRWLFALKEGRATKGTLLHIIHDTSQSINHQSPWKITYSYERYDGQKGEDYIEVWDAVNTRRSSGDALWVVYGEIDGQHTSAIWPPLH